MKEKQVIYVAIASSLSGRGGRDLDIRNRSSQLSAVIGRNKSPNSSRRTSEIPAA
jgi:hypothetical protein